LPAGSFADRQISLGRPPDPIKPRPFPRVQRLSKFDGFAHQSESPAGGVSLDAAPFAIDELASVDLNHRAMRSVLGDCGIGDGRTGCGHPTVQQCTAPRANDGEAVLVVRRIGGRGGDW